MIKITYDKGVFEELVNLSAYIADEREEIAQAFLNGCDATFQFLALNPNVGSPCKFESSGLKEIRMWRVKGFEKYLIFYVPTATGIKILHIIHSATDYNRAFDDETD